MALKKVKSESSGGKRTEKKRRFTRAEVKAASRKNRRQAAAAESRKGKARDRLTPEQRALLGQILRLDADGAMLDIHAWGPQAWRTSDVLERLGLIEILQGHLLRPTAASRESGYSISPARLP
jgi:hypothetical protein